MSVRRLKNSYKRVTAMKVIIQENIYQKAESVFKDSNLEFIRFNLSEQKRMVNAQLQTGAGCFIIGAEKYSPNFYEQIKEKSLVIRFGVGYDSVPLDTCLKRNIYVAYTPNTLDDSVAEFAIALLMSLIRHIPETHCNVKKEIWNGATGLELNGKTLAILGFGKIGRKTAQIGKYGFRMKINAFDLYLQNNEANLADLYSDNYQECVADADFISIHMSVNKENEGFFNKSKFDLMKKGVFLVNTARGRLINEPNLYDALVSGNIAGAALDVYYNEPYLPYPGKDLRTLPNILLTSHIGSNTIEANARMAESCIKNVINYYNNQYQSILLVPEIRKVMNY